MPRLLGQSIGVPYLGVFVLFVHFLAVFTKKRFQINHLKIVGFQKRLRSFSLAASGFCRRYRQKMHEKDNYPHLSLTSKSSHRNRWTSARATNSAWLRFVAPIELLEKSIVVHMSTIAGQTERTRSDDASRQWQATAIKCNGDNTTYHH